MLGPAVVIAGSQPERPGRPARPLRLCLGGRTVKTCCPQAKESWRRRRDEADHGCCRTATSVIDDGNTRQNAVLDLTVGGCVR